MARMYRERPDAGTTAVERLRAEFPSQAAQRVMDRWHDGKGPYREDLYDRSKPNPDMPQVNGRITKIEVREGAAGTSRESFSSGKIREPLFIWMAYEHRFSGPPRTVRFTISVMYEDGHRFQESARDVTMEEHYIGGTFGSSAGPTPPKRWRPGRYTAYVHARGGKAAEVRWTITP